MFSHEYILLNPGEEIIWHSVNIERKEAYYFSITYQLRFRCERCTRRLVSNVVVRFCITNIPSEPYIAKGTFKHSGLFMVYMHDKK